MRRGFAVALVGACLPLVAACGGSAQTCNNRAVPSVELTIRDATDGKPICDATVLVMAPTPMHQAVGGCPYDVFGPSPAKYTIQIFAAGYIRPMPVWIDVPSTGGACAHARTQTYTAMLQPDPGVTPGDAGTDGG